MSHQLSRVPSASPPRDANPVQAHISPIPSHTSLDHLSGQPARSQEIDPETLFQCFNRELSIIPTSKTQSTAPESRIKQAWEYRVKEFSQSNHLKPDGSNFVSWKKVQAVILRTHKWLGHAEGTDVPPPDTSSKVYGIWQTVDNLATSQLAMNMDFDLYGELADELDTAAELWRSVNTRFSKKTAAARATAKLNLDRKRILSGETMKDHITALRNLKVQYLNCGGKMDDEDWHTTIVNSLEEHDQWKTLAIFGDSLPLPDQMIAFLENQDARGFAKAYKPEAALQSRQQQCPRFRGRSTLVCPNCNRSGHLVPDCYAPGGGATHRCPQNYRIPPDLANREHANLSAQIAALERQRANLSVVNQTSFESARVANTIQHRIGDAAMIANEIGLSCESWVFDSGATSHMTNERTNFVTFEEIEPVPISTAHDNAQLLWGVGRGTVLGSFWYGDETTIVPIKDVLYVPNVSINLLSLLQLHRKGVRIFSDDDSIHFMIKGIPYARAMIKKNQWIMQMGVKTEHLVTTERQARQPLHVWHQRLGHIDLKRVEQLDRENLVSGIEIDKSRTGGDCEACILSKMPASRAVTKQLRATQPGDIIHSDLEFMGHKSFSGATISLKFVDEYSNFVWCHAIAAKTGEAILSR
ncbi:hypothetical protein ACEPAI_4169 [Sanghuangporus weigelae]